MKVDPNQRSLRSSEPSLVTVLDLLRIGILDCKSQFDILDCSLGIVPTRVFFFFTLTLICFIGFPRSSCYLLFQCMI